MVLFLPHSKWVLIHKVIYLNSLYYYIRGGFEWYDLRWIMKPLKSHGPKLVRESYANYAEIIKNINPLGKDKEIKNQPLLDMVQVWDREEDISIKAISNALFGETFELVDETPEYEYLIKDFKRVNKLPIYDKVLHYTWLADHIAEG